MNSTSLDPALKHSNTNATLVKKYNWPIHLKNDTDFMRKISTLLILFALVCVKGFGQTVQTFSYIGSTQTFTVPAGVTSVTVYAWGGGGGGGGSVGTTANWENGGGGGGGACTSATFSVTVGNSYTITVGAGGVAGSTTSPTTGGTGGNTTFTGAAGTLTANGGTGGTAASTNKNTTVAGGPGGTTGSGTGSGISGYSIRAGGSGSSGVNSTGVTGTGGGGGGSTGAGTTPANSCSGTGTGGTGTYTGGIGSYNTNCSSTSTNGAGPTGGVPGGGGSGNNSWTNASAGSAGGAGQVVIVYALSPTTTSISPSAAVAGTGAFTLTVNGTNFYSGISTVTWNGSARTTTFVSATQLTASITAADIAAAGSATVGVTTTGAAAVSNTQTFTITTPPNPTTTSISPSSATAGSGAFTITVNGTNFYSGISTVTWNGSTRTTTFVNATQLTASITALDVASAGSASVGVTTTGAAAVSNTQTFTINVPPPAIAVSPASLAFGAGIVSTQSTSQSFNLSGSNLTGFPGNITVSAPATDFQVSNNNSTWGATTTIAYSSATLAATPVYVRFTPQSIGAKAGNVTFSGGGVTSPPTVAVTGTGTYSAASDVIVATGYTYPQNIPYQNYQATDITGGSNDVELAQFTLRDGGTTTDADNVGTILTAITFSVTNSANLRRIALYDGATELGEVAGGATVTFTGLSITAADNSTKNFSVRVSYNTTVTDNQQTQFTITSVTASATGSGFAAANGGGAATSTASDNDRIEVTATQLAYAQQPSTVTAGSAMTPAVTVRAIDANSNLDLDFVSAVGLITTSTLSGTATTSVSASAGVATFSNLIFTQAGTGFTLSTTNTSSLTNITSNTFTVTPSAASDVITNSGYTYTTNVPYASFQAGSSLTTANSVGAAGLIIRDGGATTDADINSTVLSAITFSTGGSTAIRTAALFDGTTNVKEIAVNGATSMAFTGLSLTAADGSTKNFELRVTYQSAVTDDQQIVFTVTSVTAAAATSSTFGAANGGGATSSSSGNNNRIAVVATQLVFGTQPSPVNAGSAMTPSVTVQAKDGNNNLDLDFVSAVGLTTTGTYASGATTSVSASAGVATFSNLVFSTAGTGFTLTTTNASSLANTTSNTFTVNAFASATSDYFISRATGNWNATTTWTSSHDNITFYNATLTPTNAANTITVLNTHIVTVTANVSVDQLLVNSGGQITVNSGITFTIAAGPTAIDCDVSGTIANAGTITPNGVITFGNGGLYNHTQNGGTIPSATWSSVSTCLVSGCTTTVPVVASLAQSFSNFTWNCPSQTLQASTVGNLTSVSGILDIQSTGTGDLRIANSGVTTTCTYSTIQMDGGTFSFNGSGANTIIVNSITINLNGGTLTTLSSGSTGGPAALNVSGDWTNNGGTFTPSTGTVTFNGSNTLQTISGTATTTFNNITVNKGTAKTNILNVTGVITMGIAAGTNTLTITNGSFKLSSASTITPFGGTSTITPATGGFILNNTGAVSNWGTAGSPTILGDLTIINGTMTTVGSGNNALILGATGVYNQSGGTMNVKGRFQATTSGGSFTLSNGNFTIPSGGTVSTGTNSIFQATTLTTFSITGGTITVASPNLTTTLPDVNISRTGTPITGGTFVISTGSSTSTITISNNVPFYDFVVQNGTAAVIARPVTDLTIAHNLTISSGTLDEATNNKNIAIGGDYTENGTFSPGTATVTFNGTTDQNITNTNTGTNKFNNLTNNKSGGLLILQNDISLAATLTITAGNIDLNSNNLLLSATSPAIAGAPFSATKMIIADNSGSFLVKLANTAAQASYLFPIGDNTGTAEYSAITTAFTAGTFGANAYIAARVTNAKHPSNASTTNYLNRYWNLVQNQISAFSVNVSGTYTNADIAGTESLIKAAQYNGALPWIKYNTLASNTLTANGVTAINIIGIPSSLTAFSGITGANPSVTITPSSTTVCQNSTSPVLTANVTGGDPTITYLWSTGATTATISAPTTTVGTINYTVTIKDGNGISATSTAATVTINPLPTATISGTTAVCQNSTSSNITFTGANGTAPYTFTYTINGGSNQTVTTTSGNSVTVSVPTTTVGSYAYSLVSVSGQFCNQPQSGTATVTVNPLPTATISGTTTVCQNSTSPNITFTGAGGTAPYTFTYTINGGSNQTVTTTSGNSVTVATPTTTAGTYTYSLVSVSGQFCSQPQSGTATVTVNPLPTATISGTTSVCQNSTQPNITFTGANGTAPYTFTYTINGGSNQTVTTTSGNSVTVSVPTTTVGTYTYSLVSISGQLCSQSQTGSATITVAAQPTVTAPTPATQTVCTGGTLTSLTVTASGGTGAFSYQWYSNTTNSNTGGTAISGETTSTYAPSGATAGTTYYYVVVSQAGAGCGPVTSATATVIVNAQPMVTAPTPSPQRACIGGTLTPLSVTASGGTGTFSYQWYSNTTNNNTTGTAISGATTNTYAPSSATAGVTYYYVTVSQAGSGCGPVTSATGRVTIASQPTVTAPTPATQAVCAGGTLTSLSVTASGGAGTFSYQWYSNTSNSVTGGTAISGATTNTYAPSSATAGTLYYYVVVGQAGSGCGPVTSVTASVTVLAQPTVTAPTPATQTVCTGSTPASLTVTASGGTGAFSYQWYSNTTNSNTTGTAISGETTNTYAPSGATAGTMYYYVVVSQSGAGCGPVASATATVTITATPFATISYNGGAPYCPGTTGNGMVTRSGTAGGTYSASPSGLVIDANTGTIDLTTSTSGSYTVTYTVTASGGCSTYMTSTTVVIGPDTWTGAADGDWNNVNNWSCYFVPTINNDVVIPALMSGTYPSVYQSPKAMARNITIAAGASITVTTDTLQISGTISNAGIFNATVGTLEFNGTSAQTIPGNTFTSNNTIRNLIISNNVSVGDSLNITGVLSFGATGKTLSTGDKLILRSGSSLTASVGVIDPSNHIVGAVIVERYIATGTGPDPNDHPKTWQLLAVPTTGETLNQSWMEGATASNITDHTSAGNPHPGYGTMVTSDNITALADGFDAYTKLGSTVKAYNYSNDTYAGLPNTGTQLYDKRGYFVFARGDRSVYAYNQTADHTILRTKGTLFTPDNAPTSSTVHMNKFESIGNPYASPVDMTKVSATGGLVNQYIYVWDPRLGGSYNYGAFVTLQLDGTGNYEVQAPAISPTYGIAGTISNYIQSGQAFFMQATGADGTVSFSESSKAAGVNIAKLFTREGNGGLTTLSTAGARPTGQQQATSLRTTLYAAKADGTAGSPVDGILNQFDDSYNNEVDGYDARKAINTGENLSVRTGGKLLVIEKKHTIVSGDTIFLNLTGLRAQGYQFSLDATNLSRTIESGYVEDAYTSTRTPLNLKGNTQVNFTVVNVAGSYAPDRFRIVFSPLKVLPVTFASIKAYRQDRNINLEWRVNNERNIKEYGVEKSADGKAFTTMATSKPSNNNGGTAGYVIADIKPITGDNYYRIWSVDVNDAISYSTIVKVMIGKAKSDINIYPNPITDGQIHLQFENEGAGKYGIRLLNKAGQLITQKQVNREEGNSTELIKWDFNLAHGMYQLEVTKPDGSVKSLNVMY